MPWSVTLGSVVIKPHDPASAWGRGTWGSLALCCLGQALSNLDPYKLLYYLWGERGFLLFFFIINIRHLTYILLHYSQIPNTTGSFPCPHAERPAACITLTPPTSPGLSIPPGGIGFSSTGPCHACRISHWAHRLKNHSVFPFAGVSVVLKPWDLSTLGSAQWSLLVFPQW